VSKNNGSLIYACRSIHWLLLNKIYWRNKASSVGVKTSMNAEEKAARQVIKDSICEGCNNCDVDQYRLDEFAGIKKLIILQFGCGNYGFSRTFNKGFKPRKKRCKHYDEAC
jgi:hypothetical protein